MRVYLSNDPDDVLFKDIFGGFDYEIYECEYDLLNSNVWCWKADTAVRVKLGNRVK